MGCDIHLYVEKRVNGVWQSADQWRVDEEGEVNVPYKEQFYNDRNYNLFAMLADVRNGFGFAGISTGDGFVPIAEPRGIPNDASTEYKKIAARWEGDAHSHSYLTVAELMAYDWTQTATSRGVVSLAGYKEWSAWKREEGESPSSYSGDVWGQGIVKISPEEADKIIEQYRKDLEPSYDRREVENSVDAMLANQEEDRSGTRYYVNIEWESPYYKNARNFLAEVMPKLWRLGAPEDVRIVFFFDN